MVRGGPSWPNNRCTTTRPGRTRASPSVSPTANAALPRHRNRVRRQTDPPKTRPQPDQRIHARRLTLEEPQASSRILFSRGTGSPFRNGPVRALADLEDITSAWVSWYSTERLMHRGRIPRPGQRGHGTWPGGLTWDPRGGPPRALRPGQNNQARRPGKATALRPMSSHPPWQATAQAR